MPTIRGSHQSRFIVESSLQSKNYTYVLPLTLFKYITFIWTLVQSLFYTVMFAVISLSLLYPWMIILSCRSEGITRCCAVSIRWAWRVCALHSVSKYASENIMYACETSLSVLNNWALLGIHKHRKLKLYAPLEAIISLWQCCRAVFPELLKNVAISRLKHFVTTSNLWLVFQY